MVNKNKTVVNRRDFLKTTAFLGLVAGGNFSSSCGGQPADTPNNSASGPPNVVIIFADDMGYGDWSRGGHPTIHTPNLNRMADEGIQLTQFYSGGPVCSPSRTALLTGRNYVRSGVLWVFGSPDTRGLPHNELTIAEVLKPLGYNTACIGKWHLGSTAEYLPMSQGFDYFYGLPFSNDMKDADLFRNAEKIEVPADQTTLTRRYTEEAISFIAQNKDNPFFLYLPHTFPHTPLHASDEFRDSSRRGLYGDVIEELDWSTGRILDTLDSLGLRDNTLVIFTSDNGPWAQYKLDGGTSGLLRGDKGDTWEGGMRVPCIASWPGRIPEGMVSMEVASVIDFLPTIAGLAGADPIQDRPIDGIDIMPVLAGGSGPVRTIYYYQCTGGQYLTALRHGPWKQHFRIFDEKGNYHHPKSWLDLEKPQLYNLENDPAEKYEISNEHPQVVEKLTKLKEDYDSEIERLGENRELAESFLRK